jgi:hypothetical protein
MDLLVVRVVVVVQLTSLGENILAQVGLGRDGAIDEVDFPVGGSQGEKEGENDSRKFHGDGSSL